MFKRTLAAFLAAMAVLSLTACGDSGEKQSPTTEAVATEKQEPVAVPTPTEAAPTEPVATQPAEKVDEAQLRAIYRADTFPVKVKDIHVEKGYFSTGEMDTALSGLDGLMYTMENTLDEKITGYTVLVLAVDEKGQPAYAMGQYVTLEPIFGDVVYSECVLTAENTEEMDAGEEVPSVSRCISSRFENVHMMVYSYLDANGNEVVNENALLWLVNTVPVAS